MTASSEKRACQRYSYNTPIVLSCFNAKDCYDAISFNHCLEGMALKSKFPLNLGTTICIRLGYFEPDAHRSAFANGLRMITLAEVKWCRELPQAGDFAYEVGVKYCAPHY